jgi:replicative DNA helicase
MKTTVPPHNDELERLILKSILDNPEARDTFFTSIHPTDFYVDVHKENFISLKNSYIEGGDVDVRGLKLASNYLDSAEYIGAIFAEKQCKELRAFSKSRALRKLASGVLERVDSKDPDWLIVESTKALALLKSSAETYKSKACDIDSKIQERWKLLGDRKMIGLASNTSLDKLFGGYQPSHYIVLGAYTSYGKTSVATYLLSKLIKQFPETPFAFFSAEMSQLEIYEKLIVQSIGKSGYEIRSNRLDYKKQTDEIAQSNLYVYDNARTVEAIRLELQVLKVKDQLPKVVFVDYIHLIQDNGKSEYEKVTNITTDLQTLAKEMGTCIVALSQVSNEGAKPKGEVIPFKGSGAIAATADLGMQILRDTEKELAQGAELVDLEIRVAKNRHGRKGTFHLELDVDTGVISSSATL